jgi:hypothetical protein
MQPEVRMAHKLDRFDAVIDNAGVGYRERRVETSPQFGVSSLSKCSRRTFREQPSLESRLTQGGFELRMPSRARVASHAAMHTGAQINQSLRSFDQWCRFGEEEARKDHGDDKSRSRAART